MAYLAPIYRPSSVKHALKLELLVAGEECLVLAKANRLEIWSQNPESQNPESQISESVSLFHTRNMYGKVVMLGKLRPDGSATDQIFVGTDRYMYFTLYWDQLEGRLRTGKVLKDQADKTSRDSQTQDRCQLDPTRSFMALLLFDGIVTIIPLSQNPKKKTLPGTGGLGDPVPARISDLFVRSSTFLHSQPKDKQMVRLALLYEDNHQKACLSVRLLDYSPGINGEIGSADLENVLGTRDDLELGASHLIAVPAPAYGLLVLCETSICYLSDVQADIVSKSLDQPTQFVAWTPVDSQRWLIADEYGKVYFLMLLLDEEDKVTDWNLDFLGTTSQASVLVHLDADLVFIGSHQGDSQVVKIQEQGLVKMQTMSNIAPILDFSIMDLGSRSGEGQTNEYSSGQARIVTGSGAFDDGSLRSVRSGVGLEEKGILDEMKHATELFALRTNPISECNDALVVSFVDETRIFQFQPDGEVVEQTAFKSFIMTEETLLASNIEPSRLLHVTASAARLIDIESGMLLSVWATQATRPITAVSSSGISLALSVGGVEAVVLDLKNDLQVKAKRIFTDEGEIACIHAPSIVSDICIVGFWKTASILLLNVNTLDTIVKARVSEDTVSVPRSILLAQLLAGLEPTLFVAMANGEVVTFALNTKTSELSSKKIIVLGTQQANFKALPRSDGLVNVFATCEHPSLIYGSDGRIVYSAVNADKATSICSFDAEAYADCIAIATPEDVKIALVDTERTTHVNSLPIGETVRRIAYSPKLKAFGMGTIHRSLKGTEEVVRSHFKLADEILFKILDTYDLNEEELVESVIRGDMRDDSGDLAERFIVGTAYLEDDQGEAIRGRILVFGVTTERKLNLITELKVKGACRALGCLDGKIVAALVKTVVIYALRDSSLQRLATYRTSTAPIDLAIHAPTSQICIADLMKSISIVTYTPASPSHPEDALIETARHFQTAWTTACAHVDTDTWLAADADGNLMVLKQNTGGVTVDDRRRLEAVSEIRLGEMVNRIREVQVEASPSAPVVPKAFMATVDGGVYLFGQIAPPWLDLLMRLQGQLAEAVISPGGISFNAYRAYRNEVREVEEPYRFVDGDLIEAFLDLEPARQEKIVESLGEIGKAKGGLEGIKELVEGLRRLH